MDDDEAKQIARYQFKQKMEELERFKGRATEMISLYVPSSTPVSDATNYLSGEYAQSINIKSASTRKNVCAAITSIISRLRLYKTIPENGAVFFIGTVIVGNNKTAMSYNIVEPPEPIKGFLYRCDSNFFLDPLREMVRDKDSYGLVVMDRAEATIGLLVGTRIEVIQNFQSLVPSKHGRGGQSQRRFERLIEEAAHKFFKKVGEAMTSAFIDNLELRHILVGGPGATKDYFVEKDFIHHELKKKILDTLNTGYTDEYGLKEMVENAEDLLHDVQLMKEKKVMGRFFKELSKKDGGVSAYGIKEVAMALENNAVDTLILSSELPKYRLKYTCPKEECGHSAVREAKESTLTMECPKCSTSMDITETTDIVEKLIERADAGGSSIKFISPDFDEGSMLLNAFKGIAAILRFKIHV